MFGLVLLATITAIPEQIMVPSGESRWFTLPLAHSFEHQILNGEGALSPAEYQNFFRAQGLLLDHFELQYGMHQFADVETFRNWVRAEMAPRLHREGDEYFVTTYVHLALQSEDLVWMSDGFGFSLRQLLVHLERPAAAL